MKEGGRFSAQRERPLPSLDAVGYAQERASPYDRQHSGAPTVRHVADKHDAERGPFRVYQAQAWRDDAQHAMSPYASHAFDPREDLQDISGELSDDVEGDDVQDEGEMDFDDSQNSQELSAAEKKKRRRRTNKDEATILAAVFEQTAFPDVTTREALAERLNMSIRSVSIWFQNRRQAMKKRASRFGGIDGVRGATVTATPQQDSQEGRHSHEQESTAQGRLKRWLSLDEVAARAAIDAQDVSISTTSSDGVKEPSLEEKICGTVQVPDKKSCAPILDLLRKRGGHSLARIASMPSIAAALKDSEAKDAELQVKATKDLRDMLKNVVAKPRLSSGLARSASMTALSLLSRSDFALKGAEGAVPERTPEADQASTLEKTGETENLDLLPKVEAISVPKPLDVVSQAPIGLRAEERRANELQALMQDREIWKRMQSSSSGLSSESTPESDKENRDAARNALMLDQDGFEDEEKTLRRIAHRRASRQQAKNEQKLSEEGSKYLHETDARLALQQRKAMNDKAAAPRQPLAPLPAGRAFVQSCSDGSSLTRNGLSRVASLDFEAGRDRSKEVERPAVVIPSQSLAERLRLHSRNRRPSDSKRAGRVRRATDEHLVSRRSAGSAKLASRQSVLGQGQAMHHSFDIPMRKTRPNGAAIRPFAPTASMPSLLRSSSFTHTRTASHLEGQTFANPMGAGLMSRRLENATRESNTRRRQAHGPSASQNSNASEGSSEEWTEDWARDQAASVRSQYTGHQPPVEAEWWRSLKRKSPTVAEQHDGREKRTGKQSAKRIPSGGHDDSGFFGSDDAISELGDENAGLPNEHDASAKKRRLVAAYMSGQRQSSRRSPLKAIQAGSPSSAVSSSPLKRGDERDRLAAETLLAFGSHA